MRDYEAAVWLEKGTRLDVKLFSISVKRRYWMTATMKLDKPAFKVWKEADNAIKEVKRQGDSLIFAEH